MKRILVAFIMIGLIVSVISCDTEQFYSGASVVEGTTVKWLVSLGDKNLKVTAEGEKPDVPIYVKLITMYPYSEKVIGAIFDTPHENTYPLEYKDYNLYLEKNGVEIGVGGFKLDE